MQDDRARSRGAEVVSVEHVAQKAAILDKTLPKVCHLVASNRSLAVQIGAIPNPAQVAGSEREQAMEPRRRN